MAIIKELLDKKSSMVWSVSPDATVFDALSLLAEKNIGALLVIRDEKLVGLVSERDYARKVILQGKTAETTRVREIMTEGVTSVDPETSVQTAMALMSEKRFRHLPVLESSRIVGIVSIGDLVQSIITEQAFTINQLESYIAG
ncbi:MAG: CBS domain-containing protein [Thiothrix sp.]|nr:CBS domain-containing protein [Thiothrix sp.]HPQ97742.1 CBS domain-containing protein [Thiolinea sp.]